MKIAICDDKDLCRKEVLAAVNEYISQSENNAISLEVFSHAEDLLQEVYKNGGFDIYILDVVMPDTDGIKLGEKLREGDYNGKIIYLTSSKEFAIDSYRVKAFNYLLKPIDKAKFFSCLEEAVNTVLGKTDKSIIVKTKESTVKLNFENIMYAELNRRVINYNLSNGKMIESLQLRSTFTEAIQDLLNDDRFCLCGASMVMNLYHITEIGMDCVILKGNRKVYLGRKAVRDIRSAWCEFCLSEVKSI